VALTEATVASPMATVNTGKLRVALTAATVASSTATVNIGASG